MAVGSGSAVRAGVCVGVGVSAGDTVAVGCGSAAALTVADGAATAVGPSGTRGSATGAVCSPPQATNTITADRNSSSTVAAIPALVSLPHNDFMAPFSASVTVESMTRPIYPPDARFDSADAGAGGCAPWERKWQKHPPGGEGLSHSPLYEEVITFVEATFLPSFISSWQTGPFCPPTGITSGSQNTGFANRDIVVCTSGSSANVSPGWGQVKPLSKARDDRELCRILPKQQRPSTRSTGPLPLDSHR